MEADLPWSEPKKVGPMKGIGILDMDSMAHYVTKSYVSGVRFRIYDCHGRVELLFNESNWEFKVEALQRALDSVRTHMEERFGG